ncbi:MAG: hypothetical protein IKN55_05955 [Oscillospiraceae bacterium]|nr:hypothetical protein [Oscillospiraceae bacterium]
MNLLQALYSGKGPVFGEVECRDPAYIKLVGQVVEIEKQLLEISPEVAGLLEQYQDLHAKMDSIILYREFTTGFRAGAQLMREMMEDVSDPVGGENNG